MRRSQIIIAVVGFAGLLMAGQARGDVPPPEAEACLGKQVGDACDMPGGIVKGVCVQTTCTKVTPPPLPDSGPYKYPCVLCQVSADSGVKPAADLGPRPSDRGTKPADVGACPTPTACQAPVPEAGPQPAVDRGVGSKDSGAGRSVEKDSGCAVGGISMTRVVGPWFLALAVSGTLLLLGRRRRR